MYIMYKKMYEDLKGHKHAQCIVNLYMYVNVSVCVWENKDNSYTGRKLIIQLRNNQILVENVIECW